MIARFTEGPDRWRLRFAEAVVREFAFLESELGFRRTKEETTFVRYESDRLFLNVFHGRGSFEIGVELGRLAEPTTHYRLPILVAALAPEYEGRTVFQASSQEAVQNCVAEAARLLREKCGAALAGHAEALRLAEQESQAEGERLTLRYQFGATIARADEAWESKDLARAKVLYETAECALDDTRSRRLRYLLRKQGKAKFGGRDPSS